MTHADPAQTSNRRSGDLNNSSLLSSEDMIDQLHSLCDVHDAFALLETLIAPHMRPGTDLEELDRQQFGALLRILNSALSTQLQALGQLTGISGFDRG